MVVRNVPKYFPQQQHGSKFKSYQCKITYDDILIHQPN